MLQRIGSGGGCSTSMSVRVGLRMVDIPGPDAEGTVMIFLSTATRGLRGLWLRSPSSDALSNAAPISTMERNGGIAGGGVVVLVPVISVCLRWWRLSRPSPCRTNGCDVARDSWLAVCTQHCGAAALPHELRLRQSGGRGREWGAHENNPFRGDVGKEERQKLTRETARKQERKRNTRRKNETSQSR